MSKCEPTIMFFGIANDRMAESHRKRPYTLESVYYYNRLSKFRHKKFLIVEDDEVCLLLLRPILKSWNISFDIARDGKEAIEMLANKNYDFAFLDINLPYASGIEIAQTLKKNRNHRNHKTILLAVTSNNSPKVIQRILESGITSHMIKPVNRDRLYEKILECIEIDERGS